MKKDKEHDKEIYKLWIDFLRKKEAFKTAVVQFNRLKIFSYYYGFMSDLKPLSSTQDVLNYNQRLKKLDEILQIILTNSSLLKKVKNREVLVYYLLYYLFFYDIFTKDYSFEKWWGWQTYRGKYLPSRTFLLLELLSKQLNRIKPSIKNMDLRHTFFDPSSKRKRLPELKIYLQVYELREEHKMKWRDIIRTVEPIWLDRVIDSNVERTYYVYLEKAKNILKNLDWGLFPEVTILHSTNMKNRQRRYLLHDK